LHSFDFEQDFRIHGWWTKRPTDPNGKFSIKILDIVRIEKMEKWDNPRPRRSAGLDD
jgi:hypothetical protein